MSVCLSVCLCWCNCLSVCSGEEDVVVMIARLESLFLFGGQRSVDKMSHLAFMVLHKLAILAQHVSFIFVSFIVISHCPLPRTGCGNGRIYWIHFVAGWHKRRREPSLSFVRFSFASVYSCHWLLFRALCYHLVVDIFNFASTSHVIG